MAPKTKFEQNDVLTNKYRPIGIKAVAAACSVGREKPPTSDHGRSICNPDQRKARDTDRLR